ncbi:MAG: NfeD family protein [Leptolyngbyaceae cyanobacterium MO_188.B28]|nr:NfeD family protein [Leptolyngbyaceae cyanobacterium MO_188.B28]
MTLTQFWVVLGTVLCLMELFLPTAFVESTLGISAFLVALLSLLVPQFNLQVLVWMVLSLIFIFLLRRFMPKRTPSTLVESTEARTITAIEPGQTGRVIYEGNSWQARCEDDRTAIAIDQPVVVLRRKGNTLFVLPESEITP